jgi:hypothetical protein
MRPLEVPQIVPKATNSPLGLVVEPFAAPLRAMVQPPPVRPMRCHSRFNRQCFTPAHRRRCAKLRSGTLRKLAASFPVRAKLALATMRARKTGAQVVFLI